MKEYLSILCFFALVAVLGSCERTPLDLHEEMQQYGNSILLNPNRQWKTSQLPAYIGDISAFPQEMQTVIRQRFPNLVGLEGAAVIFAGTSDMASNAAKLKKAAESGACVIAPGNVSLSFLGADPLMAPHTSDNISTLLHSYSRYGAGQYFVMYDESVTPQPEAGSSSMSEEEWRELILLNQGMGDYIGTSISDYDNDPAHNENYFQTRMDPFVDWVEKVYLERSIPRTFSESSYDNLQDIIEQSGQWITFDYPYSLNVFIDKATLSDPDYLSKSGSISLEFRVYPIYMLSSNGDKAGDYYGVVSTVTPHIQSMWGPYAAAHGWTRNRIYGFWFCDMDLAFDLLNPDMTSISGLEYFDRPIPENKNDSRSYSKGKTFSISGSVSGGASGGKPYVVGQFGLGGTWTSTTNYTLETLSYTRDSSTPTVKYHFWSENVKLTDDWDDWSLINTNFPAPVRTEFSAHSMWVWHVPGYVVKDGDTQQYRLRSKINLRFSTWYHWRGALEYDSNRKDHSVNIATCDWALDRPDRTPWGFIRLRNAADNEMAHVSFYQKGKESGEPVATLTTSYGKGEEARIALPEGTYSITWDIVDGNTGAKLSSWIYRNVKVHQGYDDSSATVRISSVDGERTDQ